MPALVGYLIALAVLLGSGYAGLEWLGSTDNPATYQHPTETAKHAERKRSAPPANPNLQADGVRPSTAVEVGNAGYDAVPPADPNIKAADVGPIAEVNSAGHNEAKAIDAGADNLKPKKPNAVPPGGCMPIGLTAGGEMVFPLQCRELLETERGPVAAQKAPAQSENDAQSPVEPGEMSGNAAVTASRNEKPSNSTPVSQASPAEKNDESKPITADSTSSEAPSQNGRNQAESDDVSPTSSVKVAGKRSSADHEAKKLGKSIPTPDRSKLVKMTLLTIEFPDGHREQKLVPFRRFRNSRAQED
jgi:hypothetical protein